MVFAASTSLPDIGYALTAAEVASDAAAGSQATPRCLPSAARRLAGQLPVRPQRRCRPSRRVQLGRPARPSSMRSARLPAARRRPATSMPCGPVGRIAAQPVGAAAQQRRRTASVAAPRVGQADRQLRQALPQVALGRRRRLPRRLQHLVRVERAAVRRASPGRSRAPARAAAPSRRRPAAGPPRPWPAGGRARPAAWHSAPGRRIPISPGWCPPGPRRLALGLGIGQPGPQLQVEALGTSSCGKWPAPSSSRHRYGASTWTPEPRAALGSTHGSSAPCRCSVGAWMGDRIMRVYAIPSGRNLERRYQRWYSSAEWATDGTRHGVLVPPLGLRIGPAGP